MNQIETLKWIAENGNPIGTQIEADYLKHKSDPTFRNLAMSLASSETGYAGLDDSTKNAYQEYKKTITAQQQPQPVTPKAMSVGKPDQLPEVDPSVDSQYTFVGFANPTSLRNAQKAAEQIATESEPSYLGKAFAYARGEDQTDPNLLGQIWKGGGTGIQRMVERPVESAATVGTALLPVAWPSIVAGSGMMGAGTALDMTHNPEVTAQDVKQSAILGGLGTGVGVGMGKLATRFASPVLSKLKDFAVASERRAVDAARAANENFWKEQELEGIKTALGSRGRELLGGLTDAEAMASTLPGAPLKEVVQAHRAISEADAIAQRETLEGLKSWIMNKYPEKYALVKDAFQMSDDAALDYLLNLQKEIPIPDKLVPPDLRISIGTLASKMPYGPLRYGLERLPEKWGVPSSVVEGTARVLTDPRVSYPKAMVKGVETLARDKSRDTGTR